MLCSHLNGFLFNLITNKGSIILFKVGIYLVRFAFQDRITFEEKCTEGLVEVLEMLKNSMTFESLTEEKLAREVIAINITYEDLNYYKKKIYGKNYSL